MHTLKKVITEFHQKKSVLRQSYLAKTAGLAAVITSSPLSQSLATTYQANLTVDWPWMAFLKSLAANLTGPLPMVLGILGIAGAAIAMFSGNHGGGTQRFILLIFAISICLFAPNFMEVLQQGAGGMTVTGM